MDNTSTRTRCSAQKSTTSVAVKSFKRCLKTGPFNYRFKVPLKKLLTHRFKLDEANAAYRLFDTQTTGKGVFVF